jgi:nitroimidazol reductase NimA-like FMN-containing flavoprotein (pyridoxamine 5'-phosphate oxidase superfamily)
MTKMDPAHADTGSAQPVRMATDAAVDILVGHRIMTISTVRPDGWPQSTIVGYVNKGLSLYFVIFRSSQKFANISKDERVSIAIAEEPRALTEAKAVYAGARAVEVLEESERVHAWELLTARHPNLAPYDIPDPAVTAMMRADCLHVTVVDYTKGAGHSEAFDVATG